MIAPARIAAYETLRSLSSGRTDLPTALATLRGSLADDRDRALSAEIATGVQRYRAALDHLIVHFARRPLARLDPEIIDVLRLSIYQLTHLSRVPAAAVVDDAVKLAGRAGKRSAAGLVNAILRAISRGRRALPLPVRPSDPNDRAMALSYLATTLSHPIWLVTRWYDRLGFDPTEQWLLFNNTPAPLTLRANRIVCPSDELPERLARFDISIVRGRFAPDAFVVEAGHPLRAPGLSDGSFVVQDEASQLITLLAGPEPGGRILDTCASPGGKTTAIAATTRGRALLVACDVRPRRIDLLRRTIAATRAHVAVVQADLLAPLPFSQPFDVVLVDAPCSGLGTLRRDPDIRWRRQETDLPVLAESQRQMLRNAAEAVAPGGRLIYATCSSEPEENEEIAEDFLRTSSQFAAVHAGRVHPLLPPPVVDARGHLRTTPDRHGLEAFYGAVFERRRT